MNTEIYINYPITTEILAMPNPSKKNDGRFWKRWKKAGAVRRAVFNQQKHPERSGHEVWITNASASSFTEIAWKTKRRGSVPLDCYGEEIPPRAWPGAFPVFVEVSELKEAGVLHLFNI